MSMFANLHGMSKDTTKKKGMRKHSKQRAFLKAKALSMLVGDSSTQFLQWTVSRILADWNGDEGLTVKREDMSTYLSVVKNKVADDPAKDKEFRDIIESDMQEWAKEFQNWKNGKLPFNGQHWICHFWNETEGYSNPEIKSTAVCKIERLPMTDEVLEVWINAASNATIPTEWDWDSIGCKD